MSVPNSNALIGAFYIWPQTGVHLSHQWDKLRENFENLTPLVRGAQIALDASENHEPKDNDLSGLAHGERDFRNRWRIWYDPDLNRWALQKNSGTEPVPVWDDYLTVRDIDGRVTVHQFGGLDSSVGGFYSPLPRNLAVSSTFNPPSFEWQFQHNLNTKPILWDAYNMEDKSVIPLTVDVSDPNIAYFYFAQLQAGRAIAVAEAARGEGIRVTDGTNIFDGATRLGFNPDHFYLSNEGHGDPVVNLLPIDITDFDLSSLIHVDGSTAFTADQSMGGNKLTNVGTPVSGGDAVNKTYADALRLNIEETNGVHSFTDIDKMVFDSQSFYFDTTSGGQPIIGLRGSLGGSSSSNLAATGSFSASTEWQLAHNLNTSDLVWGVYDDQGLAMIPSKVAVHDPNTTYFYFGTNAMTGRAIVTAAGGVANIDVSPFVRKDGTIDFQANESMGGFKLTSVGTPTSGTDAANKQYVDNLTALNAFYNVTYKDGVHAIKSKNLNLNSVDFYLSQTAQGEAMLNLKYSDDYLPSFIEAPLAQTMFAIDPFAPFDYTILRSRADVKSGSCNIGFYIVPGATRGKNGTSVTGLDPIAVSSTVTLSTPSGANTVSKGDVVYMSVITNSSSKHLRVMLTIQRS
jgi:hypothetical protein